jgi:hypothetical protein
MMEIEQRTCTKCGHAITVDGEHYETPRWVHAHLADLVLCTGHKDGSSCTIWPAGSRFRESDMAQSRAAGDE